MELLLQFLTSLPLAAQLWDPTGRVRVTNLAFNRTLGYPPELDWGLMHLTLADDPQVASAGLSEKLRQALKGRSVEIAAFDYDPGFNQPRHSASNNLKRISISARPLFEAQGEVCGVVCMLTDYGEVNERLERDLMRSQKMENVEALASSVAHEFNNIFTGIRGLSELIKDAVDKQSEVYEFADSIQENIARGAELISKLSSFARELPHSLRQVRIKDYVERALPLLSIQVQRRIQIETLVDCNDEVMLDASRMDQALTNIVGNAKDAMGGTGVLRLKVNRAQPPAELDSGSGVSGPWVRLSIADSGPGISPEILERVVQPFFSTKERGKSTGLGLSVTQRIIELHQGVLEVGNSRELGGAEVSIYLPIAQAAKSSTVDTLQADGQA